jgi:hypothetical protein
MAIKELMVRKYGNASTVLKHAKKTGKTEAEVEKIVFKTSAPDPLATKMTKELVSEFISVLGLDTKPPKKGSFFSAHTPNGPDTNEQAFVQWCFKHMLDSLRSAENRGLSEINNAITNVREAEIGSLSHDDALKLIAQMQTASKNAVAKKAKRK